MFSENQFHHYLREQTNFKLQLSHLIFLFIINYYNNKKNIVSIQFPQLEYHWEKERILKISFPSIFIPIRPVENAITRPNNRFSGSEVVENKRRFCLCPAT